MSPRGYIPAAANQPTKELPWAAEPWYEHRDSAVSLSLCLPGVIWPSERNGRQDFALQETDYGFLTVSPWQCYQNPEYRNTATAPEDSIVQTNLCIDWHQLKLGQSLHRGVTQALSNVLATKFLMQNKGEHRILSAHHQLTSLPSWPRGTLIRNDQWKKQGHILLWLQFEDIFIHTEKWLAQNNVANSIPCHLIFSSHIQ